MSKRYSQTQTTIKLLCIALFGIIIPNISGLITNTFYTNSELVLSYSYFTGVIFIIWESNIYLMTFLPKKIKWPDKLHYKIIIILFFTNIIYSGIVAGLLFMFWANFSKEIFVNAEPIIKSGLLIIIVSTFVTNVYEIIYLNNERQNSLSKAEQLNIAKIQAELEVLKNQTDPHFIFNSLNTLSFLISTDTAGAKHYTNTLAIVYRYILEKKEKDFVLLKEEIEFVSNYFYLLKIRFGSSINMVIEINDISAEDFLIPPVSLQVLVENAIKHNEFTEKFPLEINVSIQSNQVIIKNLIRKKQILPNSTKTGLKNLENRYRYLTKRSINIETVNNLFIAKLPILKF